MTRASLKAWIAAALVFIGGVLGSIETQSLLPTMFALLAIGVCMGISAATESMLS